MNLDSLPTQCWVWVFWIAFFAFLIYATRDSWRSRR